MHNSIVFTSYKEMIEERVGQRCVHLEPFIYISIPYRPMYLYWMHKAQRTAYGLWIVDCGLERWKMKRYQYNEQSTTMSYVLYHA